MHITLENKQTNLNVRIEALKWHSGKPELFTEHVALVSDKQLSVRQTTNKLNHKLQKFTIIYTIKYKLIIQSKLKQLNRRENCHKTKAGQYSFW